VIAVRDEPEVNEACERIHASLKSAGVRAQIDRGRGSFGRRVTDWEIKGVPLRVEVGPRDLKEGVVTLVRRDNAEKLTLRWTRSAPGHRDSSKRCRPVCWRGRPTTRDATHDVASIDEAIEAAETGFARLAWSQVGPSRARRPSRSTPSPCAACSAATARCRSPRPNRTSTASSPSPTDRHRPIINFS
jgi:prolyl-tRNA synthetase